MQLPRWPLRRGRLRSAFWQQRRKRERANRQLRARSGWRRTGRGKRRRQSSALRSQPRWGPVSLMRSAYIVRASFMHEWTLPSSTDGWVNGILFNTLLQSLK